MPQPYMFAYFFGWHSFQLWPFTTYRWLFFQLWPFRVFLNYNIGFSIISLTSNLEHLRTVKILTFIFLWTLLSYSFFGLHLFFLGRSPVDHRARQRHGRGPLGCGHPDVARHEERAAKPARLRRGGAAHGQGLGGSAAGSGLAAGGDGLGWE